MYRISSFFTYTNILLSGCFFILSIYNHTEWCGWFSALGAWTCLAIEEARNA